MGWPPAIRPERGVRRHAGHRFPAQPRARSGASSILLNVGAYVITNIVVLEPLHHYGIVQGTSDTPHNYISKVVA